MTNESGGATASPTWPQPGEVWQTRTNLWRVRSVDQTSGDVILDRVPPIEPNTSEDYSVQTWTILVARLRHVASRLSDPPT
jgi:hypothetical protein